MPAIDAQLIARELPLLVTREMHHVGIIARRGINHDALEASLVIIVAVFGVGGWMYWMMKAR
ncbi:hypothetical protein GGR56DRAFT_671104 [Xylariaceae sp. FL0804]|nr:hypothetical protein GGR56DRAFT_671104 [Xylariaceae sp. FL0804]